MSEQPNDGGQAFPVNAPEESEYGFKFNQTECGMSVRTWLAGQAMSAIMASTEFGDNKDAAIASWSVSAADALIKELGL